MACEEELINMTAHREVLRSFSLNETETSVEQNLQQACAHHDSLMHQWVAAKDALENGTSSRCQNAECGANY